LIISLMILINCKKIQIIKSLKITTPYFLSFFSPQFKTSSNGKNYHRDYCHPE